MIILINLSLLASIIFLRAVFFHAVPINSTISVLIGFLGAFGSLAISLRFIFFCLSRDVSLHQILVNAFLVLKTSDDVTMHFRKFYVPIGVSVLIGSAIFNSVFTSFSWEHFYSDALVLAGFFIFFYTLQYWLVKLKAKLMRAQLKLL